MMTESYFKYWGKAQPMTEELAKYHLLPYHCLDVAAVGFEYLTLHESLSRYFCEHLNCDKNNWLNWAAFWLSLHDLGKFSEAFQSQKPDLFEQLQGCEPSPEKPYTERHDSLGQWIWHDRLASQFVEECGFSAETGTGLDYWMRSVTGHHGQPPKASTPYCASDDYFKAKDRKSIDEFVTHIHHLFLTDNVLNIPTLLGPVKFEKVSQMLSWLFAGVTVLADWLGSNTEYFPYKTDELSLEEYWLIARNQAKTALKESGVIPVSVKSNLTFSDFFPKIETPSPLQQWAKTVKISQSQQIYLLEDVTGAGKTEAALTLAYRLMESGNAEGFFIALPTMATANAMYDRISTLYTKLFAGNANLVLAHGSRNLVDDFAKTIIHASAIENDNEQEDETATARCTSWLADHNKRALLAQAGVGTIDQALLGVLHSKHQSLRLLGLFGKVLIIDEVHACDAYMQGVLEILLEFHARSGGSVILLSATLPEHMKQSLLSAYAKGCGARCPAIANQAYPLATWWQSCYAEILHEESLTTRAAVTRTVKVNYQHEIDSVRHAIQQALSSGKCVCWVRNTITDTLEAYALFCDELPQENIILFHARFCLQDRLNAEAMILDKFGEKSTGDKRKGRLVIATQVIEQSLDVDFDFLVSDLAPIDRLIQRAGRLQRHIRDNQGNRILNLNAVDQRGEPCIMVYAPEWSDAPAISWFKNFLPKAGYVYPDHAQLWLTAKALQNGSITMPGDARYLIESVFGDDSVIPVDLQQSNITVKGRQMADASHAKNNTLTFAAGYKRGDVMDWWSEARTPSRLGEQSMNVVLARWESERFLPWVSRNYAWAYSTVRIAERLISTAYLPSDNKKLAEYERALETLPDKGKWSILLPFEKNEAGKWVVQAWKKESKYKPANLLTWQYDSGAGLRLIDENVDEGGAE